ncbi:MAG: hypothetical protein J6Z14_14145 [Prevotella sp.]|nr:hypothetical protein [Prevotella sp.]
MKKSFLTGLAMAALVAVQAVAQNEKWWVPKNLDLSVKAGTPGYGLELSAPMANWLKVRTGFSYLPSFEVPMHFDVMVGDDPKTSHSKFTKLSGLLEGFTGQKVKDEVEMIGKPTNFWNWNLLVDFYPLKNNKHWHVSAGFYLGHSKIAKAYNATESMGALMAVNAYNKMYDKLINDQINAVPELLYEVKIIDLSVLGPEYASSNDPEMLERLQSKFKEVGRMGVNVGNYNHDVYYTEDVYVGLPNDEGDIYDADGNLINPIIAHKAGDLMHKAGTPYMLEPDNDGMVKVDMRVNAFKPYLGFGYEGRLLKGDDRWKVGFDAGVMFWGGTPSVITHDGVNLTKDIDGIGGKVGSYIDFISGLKVFPMFSVSITRRLF